MTRSRAETASFFGTNELPRSRSLWKAGINAMTLARRSDFLSSVAKLVRRSTSDFLITSGSLSGCDRRDIGLRSSTIGGNRCLSVKSVLDGRALPLSGHVGQQLFSYELRVYRRNRFV